MNKRYVIWGTGKKAEFFYQKYQKAFYDGTVQIVAFVDNDSNKWGQLFHGIKIIPPSKMLQEEYDCFDIWLNAKDEILFQTLYQLNINIKKYNNIFNEYKHKLIEKYQDKSDAEIQDFLDVMIKTDGLEVFAYNPVTVEEKRECFFDIEKNAFFTFFENKKMYFPRNRKFNLYKDGKYYVSNIWQEQDKNSPHLYEENEVVVNAGDIIIDAGVCEGNFSLHNIDKAKKVYLIECDSNWMEALQMTFEPYKDKVVFCNKFLSNYDSENTITIDSLVEEKSVDFIKMDIEGEEINALSGARRVLDESHNLRCSICSYHKHGDEQKIRRLLEEHGLVTVTSKGYMFFLYDDEIWRNPELRRGVVRGYK